MRMGLVSCMTRCHAGLLMFETGHFPVQTNPIGSLRALARRSRNGPPPVGRKKPQMQTIRTVVELRQALLQIRKPDKRVGFIPTMGYLHEGHRALIEASRAQCDASIVSIFVNPTQFAPNEDLGTYPRDFLRDEQLCQDAGVEILFAPDTQEIYPAGFETFVEPGELAKPLCGAFRPEHFRGVATVVCKLFNMVQPDVAFFWTKGLSAMRGRSSHDCRS